MKRISIILLFIVSLDAFSEQKIFFSRKILGDDLYKNILNFAKEISSKEIAAQYKIEPYFKSYENGIINFLYVSDKIKNNEVLCFDVSIMIEYDRFIVDFSNARLFNIDTGIFRNAHFSLWSTLTNSGWFKKYNEELTFIIESLESIIN